MRSRPVPIILVAFKNWSFSSTRTIAKRYSQIIDLQTLNEGKIKRQIYKLKPIQQTENNILKNSLNNN